MRLGSIDIGSNAIRLQIVQIYGQEEEIISFKKIEFLRFPLRLGKDVFNSGKISKSTAKKFIKLMNVFKQLLDLYEVDAYKAVATSAMRESKNGDKIIEKVKEKNGLDIETITGSIEAKILRKAILPYINDGKYIHIDVGGGSTELNIFMNKKIIASKSFKIGSVRKLSIEKRKQLFAEIQAWIGAVDNPKDEEIISIGTGGNINKLFKLSRNIFDKSMSLSELKAIRAYINAFSIKERESFLKMNVDRADVIVPASEIYIQVMEFINSHQIIVPKVGLKDGLVYETYEQSTSKDLSSYEKVNNI